MNTQSKHKAPLFIAAWALVPILLSGCASALDAFTGGPTLEDPQSIAIVPTDLSSPASTQLQVEAGDELQLRLAREVCCVVWESVEADVAWSLEGAPEGVVLDGQGLLSVPADTPSDTRFTVIASVAGGQQTFEREVTVYTRAANPLVGMWREVAQLACDSQGELPVETPIQELVFAADGSLSVTWFPFEAYVDYVGEYQMDEDTISFEPREVNYLPINLDTSGFYAIDEQGRLRLRLLWLGGPPGGLFGPPNCGHIFTRR